MSADGTIPEALVDRDDVAVFHAAWADLAAVVAARGGCDALIVDAPYSERTHSAHDDGAQTADRAAAWAHSERGQAARERAQPGNSVALRNYAMRPQSERERLSYEHWTPADVAAFVNGFAPIVRGWWVSLTDHLLAPAWTSALDAAGLYVFSPLACVEPGSRVRMVGDGPAQWSCFAVVARPRSAPFSKWGTLPGAYVTPPGQPRARQSSAVVGGKSSWLMERLVEDYSRPGDLICDPCCGGGTTLTAALRTGRRAIGGDMKREHAELSARAVSAPTQRPLFKEGA